MSDHDLALLGLALTLVFGMVATLALLPGARRWYRNRRPLRVEVSPHPHRQDAVFVAVTTVGDRLLQLGWCAANASDGGGYPVETTPSILREPLDPDSDGVIVMLERDKMPPNDLFWKSVTVFDTANRHATGKISARDAMALRTRSR
jgi:hypothetical protein